MEYTCGRVPYDSRRLEMLTMEIVGGVIYLDHCLIPLCSWGDFSLVDGDGLVLVLFYW